MTLTQLGITILPLACSAPSFLPSVSAATSLISAHPGKVKGIVLVTPNNPTGAIYPDELLHDFAKLAAKEKVPLVIDETYREFVQERPHSLFAKTEWRKYLIHLFSFSKSFVCFLVFPPPHPTRLPSVSS
jgi:aspartate/methionine/tyrosine aminotransferase